MALDIDAHSRDNVIFAQHDPVDVDDQNVHVVEPAFAQGLEFRLACLDVFAAHRRLRHAAVRGSGT